MVEFSSDECFNTTQPAIDLAQCFVDELRQDVQLPTSFSLDSIYPDNLTQDLREYAQGCLEPYMDCLNRTAQNARDLLPSCVRDSITNLAQCYIDNAATCALPCAGAALQWQHPYESLEYFIPTCSRIEDNLLQPMCDQMECCDVCFPQLEATTECIINEVMDIGMSFLCDLKCAQTRAAEEGSNNQQRQRALDGDDNGDEEGYDVTKTPDDVYEICSLLAPFLFGSEGGANLQAGRELVARSNYFDCLVQETMTMVRFHTGQPTRFPTSAPTDTDISGAQANMGRYSVQFFFLAPLVLGILW